MYENAPKNKTQLRTLAVRLLGCAGL